tara:strand:- start:2037 stop:3095 length:1059 start_codon:yes stop_codon:yes gene_type:complete
MKKHIAILISILIYILCISCSNTISPDEDNTNWFFAEESNDAWVFVANEGVMGEHNGSISMIDAFGNTYITGPLGDVVHSVEIFNNKLIVAINNNQKIILFDISSKGISNKIEISTDGLSPREIIVIENKAYFSVWDPDWNIYPTIPGYIKVLNLDNLQIEETIEVGIMPEGILSYNNYLWVANSGASSISKIDLQNNSVIKNIEVGPGPQNLINYNNNIYISRTFYDEYWTTFHGSSIINSNDECNITKSYGTGTPCGGSVMVYNNKVYRSYGGGISPLENNLNINTSARIGNYIQDNVNHVEIINNNIWFAIKDGYNPNPGQIKVTDIAGQEIANYSVGIFPGDFAYWKK